MNRFLRLMRLGRSVIGLNRRNLSCILPNNPRSALLSVDDKVVAKERLHSCGIATPTTRMVIDRHAAIGQFLIARAEWSDYALKPVCGSGGRGFRLGIRQDDGRWCNHAGRSIDDEELRFHLASILAGEHSLDGSPDQVLVEELLREDPAIRSIHGGVGVSDVRVIACHGRPVMAMLRLPTARSGGAANLHAGGIGVGIDLGTGRTTYAVSRGCPVKQHPDSGHLLSGITVPGWDHILTIAERVNDAFGMGYLGVDCVLERRGVMVLEVNARPGLEIQLANRRGMAEALAAAGVPIP